jgi:uncharacterized protein YqeY
MATLEEHINADIKAAMLAKDAARLEALRAVKSALLLLKTSETGSTPDMEMKTLQKLVKQRKEAADIYDQQGRADLADPERFQASVIETYLPKQMSLQELEERIGTLLREMGIQTPQEAGKAIGLINKQLAGLADGKMIADTVKKLLSA